MVGSILCGRQGETLLVGAESSRSGQGAACQGSRVEQSLTSSVAGAVWSPAPGAAASNAVSIRVAGHLLPRFDAQARHRLPDHIDGAGDAEQIVFRRLGEAGIHGGGHVGHLAGLVPDTVGPRLQGLGTERAG